MKAVERYLYIRKGYYYYRSGIPQSLRSVLGLKELVVALGTQDLTVARLQSVQLNYELTKRIHVLKQECVKSLSDRLTEQVIGDFLSGIEEVKSSFGYEPSEKYNHLKGVTGKKDRRILFSEIVEKYLEDCPSDSPSTRFQKEATYTLFIELMGDIPFKNIGVETGRQFKSCLLKIPVNAKKTLGITSFKGVDLDKLPCGKKQSYKTINNRFAYLIGLFNWAKRTGYYEDQNPFAHLTIKSKDNPSSRRHPFKEEDIEALFRCSIYTGCKGEQWRDRFIEGDQIIRDSLYWVPLIGLYSGMRMNEICQLYASDVGQENGIWFFDINDNGEDKALKTQSSQRRVPIHTELIRQGFIDYVNTMKEREENRLFPEIEAGGASRSYSHTFSKKFRRVLDALNIKRDGICFHSLRHTFIDGLRNAGVERSVVMALTGHQSSKDVHGGYGYGYNLSVLQERMNKLVFPVLF